MRTRRTLRGHLAKIYAMHWAMDSRNLVILLGHWCLHAYGIVAVTELKQLSLHLPLICLVPVPALFYILTARFTDPARINGGSDIS